MVGLVATSNVKPIPHRYVAYGDDCSAFLLRLAR